MSIKQRTIKKPVTLSGKGLHTGLHVDLTFMPAPEDHGYIFKRTDLERQPLIHATADNVADTSRGTTIEENGEKVGTVEHIMAALYGLEIDNVLMEISGPEVPIIDGSSKFVVKALKEAGITDQKKEKDYLEIRQKIVYSDPAKGIEIVVFPDDKFSVDAMIDFNSRVLGHQYASLSGLQDFEQEIAPCRTFVFFHELEFLLKNNLIKGGDLENAIVILEHEVAQEELDRIADLFNKPRIKRNSEGVLNNLDMYFSNEPARHKLLDIVGDLALVGRPIKGRVVARRPGHFANNQVARKIRDIIKKDADKSNIPEYDPSVEPVYNVNQIMGILPHRPPFLLVDKIIAITDFSIVGVKNVTMNEGFFVGHFPSEPIMPGVLQVEAMAQVGGILVLSSVPDPKNYSTYFLKIDKVKFKNKVIPGDTLIFQLKYLAPVKHGIVYMFGQAFVGDRLVMEGELMAQIVKTKTT
ncbi:MAG: bifunctional UDP-3-O-[3-hydroxymyristoyl] N-acetylglucosamine deacetylase/3-hydroxyacyl-ACP dehydratase [Bacteroidales bacterium]